VLYETRCVYFIDQGIRTNTSLRDGFSLPLLIAVHPLGGVTEVDSWLTCTLSD
jgi:hypothetical protein